MKRGTCCICKGPLENEWGNNPTGAVIKGRKKEFKPEDRCCDSCNAKFVIPGRLLKILGKVK